MTDYFLDASALVKRYADEVGSDWVREISGPESGHTILLAEVTLPEVSAALAAKQRATGGLTRRQMERIFSRFLEDCDEFFLLLPVDRTVIDLASELPQTHRLRGYDAVQLASALVANQTLTARNLEPLVFVASDEDLLTAAKAENLTIENPLYHNV